MAALRACACSYSPAASSEVAVAAGWVTSAVNYAEAAGTFLQLGQTQQGQMVVHSPAVVSEVVEEVVQATSAGYRCCDVAYWGKMRQKAGHSLEALTETRVRLHRGRIREPTTSLPRRDAIAHDCGERANHKSSTERHDCT